MNGRKERKNTHMVKRRIDKGRKQGRDIMGQKNKGKRRKREERSRMIEGKVQGKKIYEAREIRLTTA